MLFKAKKLEETPSVRECGWKRDVCGLEPRAEEKQETEKSEMLCQRRKREKHGPWKSNGEGLPWRRGVGCGELCSLAMADEH